VMKIVLTVLPRQETEEEKGKKADYEKLQDRNRELIRYLRLASLQDSQNKRASITRGFKELSKLLNRPLPVDKNGNNLGDSTKDGRDWMIETKKIAQQEIDDLPNRLASLNAMIQKRVRERDELFDAGLTLSGDIYRVVGFDRDKTTAGKIEGGVIVKAYEIKNPDPKKK
jgi:hypothetical protein